MGSAVEDRPRGYAQLAAFMTLDEEFAVLKRFAYLHLRSLLYQGDVLAQLEERLEALDDDEAVQGYLSSRRGDGNRDRTSLLEDLKMQLQSYGRCSLLRNHVSQRT